MISGQALFECSIPREALVAALMRAMLPLSVLVPFDILVILVFPSSPLLLTPSSLPLRYFGGRLHLRLPAN